MRKMEIVMRKGLIRPQATFSIHSLNLPNCKQSCQTNIVRQL